MSYENFDPNDLLIQSYSTKPSGFVHRIPHGIKAIHLPTGTVVTCDADRSQHKNRHDALTQLWEQVQGKPTYQELLAERDALAAQAQALKTAAKFILDAKKPETKRKAYAALADAVNKTPQQHLAEIRAEAGRAGFIAGVYERDRNIFMANINRKADEYADSIRQGEVE